LESTSNEVTVNGWFLAQLSLINSLKQYNVIFGSKSPRGVGSTEKGRPETGRWERQVVVLLMSAEQMGGEGKIQDVKSVTEV
jgi:hypothetical protein